MKGRMYTFDEIKMLIPGTKVWYESERTMGDIRAIRHNVNEHDIVLWNSGSNYIPFDESNYVFHQMAIYEWIEEDVRLLGMAAEQYDTVNHPAHYTTGKIEVIDFIEDKNLNYHRGNAVKYISRAGIKDKNKEIEDLKKAAWYINREIERLENVQEVL